MFELVQQTRSVGFELEAVARLSQSHLLTRHDILAGDIAADSSKDFGRRQFVLLPTLILLVGAALRRSLIAELGDQRFGPRKVLPQPRVRFQLVEVLGQSILEYLPFLLVDAVRFSQQIDSLRPFHLPRLGDAPAQYFRRDEIVIAVRLHLDMFRSSQKDHDLRGEPLDTDPCESVLRQACLADEREVFVNPGDARLLPELALQERAGHDQHQQSR